MPIDLTLRQTIDKPAKIQLRMAKKDRKSVPAYGKLH